MPTLYELTGQVKAIHDMFESGDIDEQTLNDTMESLNTDIEEKAEGYAKIITEFKADKAAAKAEIDRLKSYIEVKDNNMERLKSNLMDAMQAQGKQKIKAGTFTVSIGKNPAGVNVVDEKLIPDTYFITPDPVLSKKDILADLKSGKEIPGVELKQGESLRIK